MNTKDKTLNKSLIHEHSDDSSMPEFSRKRGALDSHTVQLSNAITLIELSFETDSFPPHLLEKLIRVMPVIDSGTAIVYDDQFDIRSEITMQLRFVAALRDEMFTNDGKMKEGFNKEDIKYVLDASKELRKSLDEAHGKYLSYERVQGIIKAFTDTITGLEDDDLRLKLLSALKDSLDLTSGVD